jgi:hypothetical protein
MSPHALYEQTYRRVVEPQAGPHDFTLRANTEETPRIDVMAYRGEAAVFFVSLGMSLAPQSADKRGIGERSELVWKISPDADRPLLQRLGTMFYRAAMAPFRGGYAYGQGHTLSEGTGRPLFVDARIHGLLFAPPGVGVPFARQLERELRPARFHEVIALTKSELAEAEMTTNIERLVALADRIRAERPIYDHESFRTSSAN